VPRIASSLTGLALGALMSIAAANADSPTLDKIRQSGQITRGYRDASIPFSYLGADQKPIGISLDLCAAVVDKIKSELKLNSLAVTLQPVNGSNRIPLIQNGTVNIECGGTSSSAVRLQQVSFSVATFVSSSRWLVKTASGIKDVSGLAGKTIVVTQGSNAVGFAQGIKARGVNYNILQAKDHAESMLMLQSGRAVAFMEDDILLASLKSVQPNPNDYALLPETYDLVPYGLMLPKDDPEFKAIVDGVLTSMMASGEFAKLYAKWFEQPIPPKGANLNFPMSDPLKERVAQPSDSIKF